MQTNDIVINDEGIVYRILSVNEDTVLAIDCSGRRMPVCISRSDELKPYAESDLLHNCPEADRTIQDIPASDVAVMHKRYALIAPILPFVGDDRKRSRMICAVSELNNVSLPTVRRYLCKYLAYGKIEVLAPYRKKRVKELSSDEKIFRWALNKYYYTRYKQKLTVVYQTMLKEKYTDTAGQLLPDYPKFHSFKHFFYKSRKTQTELIARNGLSNYQRNDRPLLGSIRDFAPAVGVGMLDATVCDIYLVNDANKLVGRPVLTLCVDAYSSLVCGYFLSWESGIYSLRELMQNVISNKVEWCRRFGIDVSPGDWPCEQLPGKLVTDRGAEYVGDTFGQISELGVSIINLPAYRPELKGVVESSFHQLQELYKPLLKGKGVVEPDANERGVHDYRKDACLTMSDFEKIIIHCIVYYNSKRLLENFPFSKDMLKYGIKPYASTIWNYGKDQPGAHLITVTPERLRLTLLPRTVGKFTRRGLIVNKQRYRHTEGDFTEDYLNGGNAAVAFDSDNIGTVWLYREDTYYPFVLIVKRYDALSLSEYNSLEERRKAVADAEKDVYTQAKIDLASQIEMIAECRTKAEKPSAKNVRKTRADEKRKRRITNE